MSEDRRIRKSRAALRHALFEMMKHQQVSSISIKSLCEKADVNRSTFYANYDSIEALLCDVHESLFLEMDELLGLTDRQLTYLHTLVPQETLVKIIELLSHEDSPFHVLMKNNEAHLFERNMSRRFIARYGLTDAPYALRYAFLYRSIGSFTLINQWLLDGRPCTAQALAQQLCELSMP